MSRLTKPALLAAALLTAPNGAAAQSTADPGDPSWARDFELNTLKSLAATRTGPDAKLAPFTTDGCSGGMSTTWSLAARAIPELSQMHGSHPPWEDCCVTHDRAYHTGGADPDPQASYQARLDADEALRTCVRGTAHSRSEPLADQYNLSAEDIELAYSLIADAMFSAVRLGGLPCTGLPWRWGYGWPHCSPTRN